MKELYCATEKLEKKTDNFTEKVAKAETEREIALMFDLDPDTATVGDFVLVAAEEVFGIQRDFWKKRLVDVDEKDGKFFDLLDSENFITFRQV